VSSSSENTSRFLAALARSTGESADAAVVAAPASPQPVVPPPAAAPAEGAVRTFPMEDPAPGTEPPR
jgi:hypothetical protein